MKIASGFINPNDFYPGTVGNALNDAQVVTNIGGSIISIIRYTGIIITVIALMILGIKYMAGSVEEKAEYKKTMIPYIIGVFILFALSQIIALVMDITNGML